MTKPRLLFVSHCLPYPVDGGVRIRTFNILRLLAEAFEVRALCFFRKSKRLTGDGMNEALQELGCYADITAYAIPQEHSTVRMGWDHARSLVTRRAYTYYSYQSYEYSRDLSRALSEFRPDIIHVDSLDMSRHLPQLVGHAPVVCGHHNVESDLLRRRSRAEAGWRRKYLSIQGALTEQEERKWLANVSLNVAVSGADLDVLKQRSIGARCIVVPNGVDTAQIRALPDASTGIVFVGGATWFPNRDALEYFAKSILPHVRARSGDVPITWVGNADPADRERMLEQHGIELTGYVDDIEPFVRDAACYIVPLRVGGGTRLKIVYAWAMARAVVSTSVGCEGLNARDEHNILVADDPKQFAEAIARVLEDSSLRNRLAAEARRTAVGEFDWNVLGNSMIPEYLALVGKGHRRTAPAE